MFSCVFFYFSYVKKCACTPLQVSLFQKNVPVVLIELSKENFRKELFAIAQDLESKNVSVFRKKQNPLRSGLILFGWGEEGLFATLMIPALPFRG
jgi:hypothetical protein